MLKKYIIEREIPEIGESTFTQFCQMATSSDLGIGQLGGKVEWKQSLVTDRKIYCLFMAESEEVVRVHAHLGGFSLDSVSEVKRTIDPTTATLADVPLIYSEKIDSDYVI